VYWLPKVPPQAAPSANSWSRVRTRKSVTRPNREASPTPTGPNRSASHGTRRHWFGLDDAIRGGNTLVYQIAPSFQQGKRFGHTRWHC
jgi:hypothetical protein